MNGLIERTSYDGRRVELRRLMLLAIAITLLSVAWHLLKRPLIHSLATASVGSWRSDLQRAGLRQAGFPIQETPTEVPDFLLGHCIPSAGWLAWMDLHGTGGLSIANGHFQPIGSLLQQFDGPLVDLGSDGRWEARVSVWSFMLNMPPWGGWWHYVGVLRFAGSENEVVGLALFESNWWERMKGIRVYPRWMDTDGDGTEELAFIVLAVPNTTLAGPGRQTGDILASFKYDAPSGLLRPDILPPDGPLIWWNPPNDAPVRIESDADLEVVFPGLLRIPTSLPTTSPGSAAARGPGSLTAPAR